MKKQKCKIATAVLTAVLSVVGAGCTSTSKRTAILGGGTAAGAGIGYALADDDNKAAGTAIGAVGGALATSLALGEDREVYQRGLDEGYMLGSADSAKRLYWAKQDLERQRANIGAGNGAVRYYVWEDEGMASDGRKLAPERVAVPIYEPTR
jgi:hypothetical protein